MTLTDERVVAHLVDHAERALPPMSLDAGSVLAAGRRYRRRRRRAAAAAGACLALAAVAVGAQLLPGRDAPTAPPAASGGAGPRVWQPSEAREVTTELGPALELTGPELPGADAILLVPVGVDAAPEPPVLTVEVRTRTGGALDAPQDVVRWPLETDGVTYADLDEAFDRTETGTVRGDVVTLVGAVPPGADRTVLQVLETRVELRPFTTDLLPGRAVYVAVVDVSALDGLPEIAVRHTGDLVDQGWVLLP
ncbi:MAG: hypothetical protein GX609_01390 [Actinomycetales bacterium]|nr:hypothetical protein [Actinomycetales bacterium]